MIEEQPTFVRLDRRGAGADLGALPPRPAATHDVAVLAPIDQVRALADKDVAKRVCPVSLGRLSMRNFPLNFRGNNTPFRL